MKKTIITILGLILLTIPSLLPFFNARFFYTQDYIFIARLNQMSAALADGQFPVRWAPDLRFGEPIFNFYAPLPYYIGAVIHLLGFNYLMLAKILFITSSILSALTMYIFIKELLGNKAGIVASVLYTYAPYRAVDIYVRGSLSETWAFVFFPLIFYYSLRVFKNANFKSILFLSLSLSGLFLTHNVTTVMFLPFLILWWIYLLILKYRTLADTKDSAFLLIWHLCVALVLGIGLAAFFILPAIFERDFIQTKYLTVGYFDFRAHFVAFKQFFSLFWGYGSSLWGPNDGLSFQVGMINWLVLLTTFVFAIIFRKDKNLLGLTLFLGVSFIASIFLQHNKSAFIWEAFPIMAFIQFPWRFLAISVFIVAIAGGVITTYFERNSKELIRFKNKSNLLILFLIVATIASTFSYFKPKEYTDDSFFDKFLNKEKMRQGIDLTKDYLPIWVKTVDGAVFNAPRAEKGSIEVTNINKKSTSLSASVKVLDDSSIELPITYFPGWEVRTNDRVINQENPSKMGLIRFKLPKGIFNIKIELKNTPVRAIGNWISLISALAVIALLAVRKNYSK